MTHTDWELQRERLSAYLDSELPASERVAIEAHLPTCDECQRELAALRQTRALLRSLPAPALPRSFTLPATAGGAPARRRGVPAWARPAQALGSIAAMIGLGLLVTTTLPHPSFGGASRASDAHAPAGASSSAPAGTIPSLTGSGAPITPQPSGTTIYGPIIKGGSTASPAEPAQPFPVAPVTGATLLVGGAAAVTAGSLARRRGRRAA